MNENFCWWCEKPIDKDDLIKINGEPMHIQCAVAHKRGEEIRAELDRDYND